MKQNRFLLILLLAMPFGALAQDGLGDLLKGSAADAKYLAEGYVTPMMRAFGYGMNQGWYNTAKPHKFPGFDLTLSVNPVMIPSSAKVFEVDNTRLNNMYLDKDVNGVNVSPTGKGNIPTFFGSDKGLAHFSPKNGATFSGFSSPSGIDFNMLPLPTLNLGIGLPKGTDLKLRFIPNIDLNKVSGGEVTGKFGLFGIGVMHDIKQWIPGIKQLPFDLSGFVGYTKTTLDVGITEGGPNGKGEFTCSATTIQVLISKKISVLTPYAGVGYNTATTKLNVKGQYDLNGNGNSTDTGEKDPVAISVDSTGPRITGGLRLKFGPITFHGDYTLAKYKSASVGFGIAVR